ncbi:prolyl oligopeptidase family serine peptidase [Halobaculum sp. CBA1158]|uniref:S9 family peptidase n=1 Tax=Halobaculum sp. CBA1158 TaxID=2904243 RepID=UPI001F31942F|nr:prolyl oligopeptidase family serine peptidase [Halobaculum sp. CBA1158]UIO99211.1 prolyl oligopeptidase family serine peptidase [Halobaculum sp. CBA1158]
MTDDPDDTLRALAELPTMAHPTPTPDGDEVALYYDIDGRNELYRLDPGTGDLERWSDGQVPKDARHGFAWDADGERVFFHLDEAGNEQNDVHAIDRDGVAEPVVEMDGQVTLQSVGDDGETLLVGSNAGGQMNVYRHDLPTGETTALTDYDRAVWTAELSPDCERFAFMTNTSEDYDNADVFVASVARSATESRPAAGDAVDGSNARNLEVGETGAEAAPADWHPAGDALLVSDNTPDTGRCGVYDLETDEVAWYGSGEYEETPGFFLPDGDRFLATRSRDAEAVPVVYDVESGDGRELDLPGGVASLADDTPLDDGRVLIQHTTPTRRPELIAYDIDTDDHETVLEAEYGPFAPEDFVDAEYLTVESDGVPETPQRAVEHDPYEELEIGAILYDSGERPSPLIVNPHGGPRARDTLSFGYRTQFLLSRGFSVLQVNYRGSTGRGREFVEELYDDWGGAEQGDVATAAEHVLAEYDWLDEDRVVVYGGSYGGYSANWQLVQYPDLYDAGITWVGVSDLFDMAENTMPHFRSELMVKYLGEPEENEALYEERSPVTHADNLAAPLLIVHGVNDRRVPVSQARLLRDALAETGLEEGEDFEYEELGEEGHGSSDIEDKLRSLELLDDFLDRHIGTVDAAVAASDD